MRRQSHTDGGGGGGEDGGRGRLTPLSGASHPRELVNTGTVW